MPTPEEHPAFQAFLEVWNAPFDRSNGSRMALDDKEMSVIWAGEQFAAADPPADVRAALVAWLRARDTDGPWNAARGALRALGEPVED